MMMIMTTIMITMMMMMVVTGSSAGHGPVVYDRLCLLDLTNEDQGFRWAHMNETVVSVVRLGGRA